VTENSNIETGRRRIGERIRKARKRLRLTAGDVAFAAGVSRPTLQKIEQGGDANLESINRVLNTFHRHAELIIRKND
jgi:transcriptional regulator with XRE-family HTH domain